MHEGYDDFSPAAPFPNMLLSLAGFPRLQPLLVKVSWVGIGFSWLSE